MSFVWVAGSLPPEWEHLTQLSVLSLQNNTLTGTLPPSWGKGMRALRELRLAFNNVRGAQLPREEWDCAFNPPRGTPSCHARH